MGTCKTHYIEQLVHASTQYEQQTQQTDLYIYSTYGSFTSPFLTYLVVMVEHAEVANGKNQFMQKCMILKVGAIPAINLTILNG